jgi:Na+/H+ antiporter NhaD/arsenite permease-like protein
MAFDYSIFLSLAFLFGMAAQFRAADGHSFLRGVISALEGRLGLMYAVVAVTTVFSPFVLNDVLVLILTPVIIAYSKESGTDIAPLLVAEITFTNLASALTPLGNPQNILLWQASGISAASFVAGAWPPLVLAGVIGVVLLFLFRREVAPQAKVPTALGSLSAAVYLAGTVAIVFVLNFLGVSTVVALGVAFAFGFAFTFRTPRRLAKEFDLKSLLTLYVLVGAVAVAAALIGPLLAPYVAPVATGTQPYTAGFLGLVSAAISNVPATQLVLSTTGVTPHVAPILAVDTGLAGNIDPISSFANLLALTMVRRAGLPIRRAIILQLVVGLVTFVPAFL